jgi:hypothetical protein
MGKISRGGSLPKPATSHRDGFMTPGERLAAVLSMEEEEDTDIDPGKDSSQGVVSFESNLPIEPAAIPDPTHRVVIDTPFLEITLDAIAYYIGDYWISMVTKSPGPAFRERLFQETVQLTIEDKGPISVRISGPPVPSDSGTSVMLLFLKSEVFDA